MAAVAALCVQYEADFRPNMSIVVKALQPLLNTRSGHPGEAPGSWTLETRPSSLFCSVWFSKMLSFKLVCWLLVVDYLYVYFEALLVSVISEPTLFRFIFGCMGGSVLANSGHAFLKSLHDTLVDEKSKCFEFEALNRCSELGANSNIFGLVSFDHLVVLERFNSTLSHFSTVKLKIILYKYIICSKAQVVRE